MLFAWLGLILMGMVVLGSRSVANGYLLVMRSSRHRLILLEHGADGKYHLFSLFMLPIVLFRYLVLNVVFSLLLLHRRTSGVTHSRKQMPVVVKI